MIARIWRGATSAEDADAYVDYLQETGLKEYRATPGNEAASLLRREVGDRTEFLALTFWASLDAIRGFAGKEIDTAVFYPEDARYLVERDTTVSHYEAREMAGRRTVPVEQGAISRVWHGWTSRENAGAYEALLEAEVLPGIHDRIEGFKGVFLLRRDADEGIEFVTITRWASLEAIRAFAGDDHEAAVAPRRPVRSSTASTSARATTRRSQRAARLTRGRGRAATDVTRAGRERKRSRARPLRPLGGPGRRRYSGRVPRPEGAS